MSVIRALLQTQPPGCLSISHSRSMTAKHTGRQTGNYPGKPMRVMCKCKQSFMICRQGQCVSVLASQTFFKLAAELRCSRCSFVKGSIAWACLGRTEHSPSSVSSPEQSLLRSC